MTAPLVLVANSADSTIVAFTFTDGSLAPAASNTLPGSSSTFAVDAGRGLVYAAVKGAEPAVVTFALNRTDGVLTEIGYRTVPAPLAYLELTHDGGLLLGASYHGGAGWVWPVADGALGTPTAQIAFANLHCVKVTADGGNAYFVSLGDDLIAQYALSPEGALSPLDPPTVACPAGSGPRHLVWAADDRNAYLVTEFSGEVVRFARDPDGRLTRGEAVSIIDPDAGLAHSRYGADPRAEHLIWGADVHLADQGRLLLATERTAGTIASVAVGPDGVLGRPLDVHPTEPQPRGFCVLPDGRTVVVAGELSTTISLHVIDDEGRLHDVDTVESGRGGNWVRTVVPPNNA